MDFCGIQRQVGGISETNIAEILLSNSTGYVQKLWCNFSLWGGMCEALALTDLETLVFN